MNFAKEKCMALSAEKVVEVADRKGLTGRDRIIFYLLYRNSVPPNDAITLSALALGIILHENCEAIQAAIAAVDKLR